MSSAYAKYGQVNAKALAEVEARSPVADKLMEIDTRMPGYAHVTVQGTCGPDVTAEDVRKRFYHSYFGGRDEWVKDGRFGVTIHTD